MPEGQGGSRQDRVKPRPGDLVSFTVVCATQSGAPFAALESGITLERLREFQPTAESRAAVTTALRELGFEVFTVPSPVVSARGTVELFEQTFGVGLVRVRRTTERGVVYEAIVADGDPDDVLIPVARVRGAIRIILDEPPAPLAPRLPPTVGRTGPPTLRVPGDLSQLTRAARVHRRSAVGPGATGYGVGVAIVDSGFAQHPWFDDSGFDITRVAAPNSANPDVDAHDHGTGLLGPLLSCAPDASVLAVKFDQPFQTAFDLAATTPGVRVISVSYAIDHKGRRKLKPAAAAWSLSLLDAVARGITVVAGAGNGQHAFPAMMPEVIAVGGLEIDANDAIQHWPLSSWFTHPIYPTRSVPDVSAMASPTLAPNSVDALWDTTGGTSAAAPQVAAIAALLLQKAPALTPAQVKRALVDTATNLGDARTGAGLVNAFAAWYAV